MPVLCPQSPIRCADFSSLSCSLPPLSTGLYLIIHPSLCWNGSNSFHLCAYSAKKTPRVGPATRCSPTTPTPLLNFTSFPTKPSVWFHSAFKSKISLRCRGPSLALRGSRKRSASALSPRICGHLDTGDSRSPCNEQTLVH